MTMHFIFGIYGQGFLAQHSNNWKTYGLPFRPSVECVLLEKFAKV